MRVLLKLSGEALAGGQQGGLDYNMLNEVGDIILGLRRKKIEVGIVVGAGNIIRGSELIEIDRCNADNMGMLAININSIALGDVLSKKGLHVKMMNSFGIEGIVERFNKPKALKALKDGKVIIFGGGIGNPYFTTDTAGVLRALEIEADLIIKATKVDGVYDKDPIKNLDAVFYKNISYDDIITKNIKVMDLASIALAKENKLIIKVISLYKDGAILRAIMGKEEGTTIS